MVKDRDDFHDIGDAVGAAAEFPRETPALEGGHHLSSPAGGWDLLTVPVDWEDRDEA